MPHQLAVRLPSDVLASLDDLVRSKRFPTRAAAVRAAIDALIDSERRRSIDEAIVDGYTRVPQTEEELSAATRAGTEAIDAEPWERFW